MDSGRKVEYAEILLRARRGWPKRAENGRKVAERTGTRRERQTKEGNKNEEVETREWGGKRRDSRR